MKQAEIASPALDLWSLGWTQLEIAKTLGDLHHATIGRIVERARLAGDARAISSKQNRILRAAKLRADAAPPGADLATAVASDRAELGIRVIKWRRSTLGSFTTSDPGTVEISLPFVSMLRGVPGYVE